MRKGRGVAASALFLLRPPLLVGGYIAQTFACASVRECHLTTDSEQVSSPASQSRPWWFVERKAFLAGCWERGVAPDDNASKIHLRIAAHRYLRAAHDLLAHYLDSEWEREESEDEAADLLIAELNRGGATFRLSGTPNIAWDQCEDDDEMWRARKAREEALRTMPYLDYLQTPEWDSREKNGRAAVPWSRGR